MDEKPNVNPDAAALIADSAIFKASGKLEKALKPFRDAYDNMSDKEVTKMMANVKIVFQPKDR